MTALSFYARDGSNVRLPDLHTAHHSYRHAQGLFILSGPINMPTKFQLRFEGIGIVKIHALVTKEHAIKLVQSKSCLPKGCIRLKNADSFVYEVSFNPEEKSFRFFNKDYGNKKICGGGMLIFDIEYGEVCVTALSVPPEVIFDSVNHSSHIKTIRRIGFSSAQLTCFNPLGLCRLHSPVKKGQALRLRITGNKGHPGVGPYIRFYMVEKNDLDQTAAWRLSFEDAVHGDILLIEASQQKEVVLIFTDGREPCMRKLTKSNGVIQLSWPGSMNCILWFELYKVTLKVFDMNSSALKLPANAIDVNPQCYDQLQPWVTSVERQNANVCAPFLPNIYLKEDTDVKNIYQANSAESSFQEETACKMAVSSKQANIHEANSAESSFQEETACKMAVSSKQADIHEANSAESSFQEETACKVVGRPKQDWFEYDLRGNKAKNVETCSAKNYGSNSHEEDTIVKQGANISIGQFHIKPSYVTTLPLSQGKKKNLPMPNNESPEPFFYVPAPTGPESSATEKNMFDIKALHEVSLRTESVPSEVDSSGSYFLSDTKLGCLFTNEPNQTVSLTARERTAAITDLNIYEDINHIHGFKSHKKFQDHHYSLPHNISSSEQIDSNLAFAELDVLHD